MVRCGTFAPVRKNESWRMNSTKKKPFSPENGFFGGDTRIWTGDQGFADPCLTTWLCRRILLYVSLVKKRTLKIVLSVLWSGWRGSNSLPPPWQGGALPDELHPHLWCLRSESNQWHEDFQSSALPTELQRQMWRPGTGSNRRPLAWQASVLTSWTTGPHWWEQQGSNLWPSACKADALPAELCSRTVAVILTAELEYHKKSALSTKKWKKSRKIFRNFFAAV